MNTSSAASAVRVGQVVAREVVEYTSESSQRLKNSDGEQGEGETWNHSVDSGLSLMDVSTGTFSFSLCFTQPSPFESVFSRG